MYKKRVRVIFVILVYLAYNFRRCKNLCMSPWTQGQFCIFVHFETRKKSSGKLLTFGKSGTYTYSYYTMCTVHHDYEGSFTYYAIS